MVRRREMRLSRAVAACHDACQPIFRVPGRSAVHLDAFFVAYLEDCAMA